ncbi:VOC family protein [Mycobacterium sp. NBC_00419]|uniref:VOC family protein n=1 Tax=Mycobacterium sp. NBC_00419 TaxID=2975989 RepID=UPI002E249180
MTNVAAPLQIPPNHLPSLLELTVFVSNVDESSQFYRALGFRLFEVDAPGYPQMVDGSLGINTGFQIVSAGSRSPTHIQLGFYVADLAVVANALQRLSIPYQLPMPRRLTTEDPDGNHLHLTELARDDRTSPA